MDPNTAWVNLQRLVITAHWQEAKEQARDLLDWLKKDGFAPRISGHPTFDRSLCRSNLPTDRGMVIRPPDLKGSGIFRSSRIQYVEPFLW